MSRDTARHRLPAGVAERIPITGHAQTNLAGATRRDGAASMRCSTMTIAVTSGKGGVGKTNLAVNLAICLARRGLRVTLADVDVGLANADLLLGVQPRYNLSHFLSGQRELVEIATTAVGGVRFIAGASGALGTASLTAFDFQRTVRALGELDGDQVILDCGAGIGHATLTFACRADVVLVVTTPEPPALADAYATVKALLHEGYTGSVRVLLNMVDSRIEAKAAAQRIRSVAKKFLEFPIADAGYLLHDSYVELAVRQRVPFVVRYPRCSASACVAVVAARLANGIAEAPRANGLFRRVAGIFG